MSSVKAAAAPSPVKQIVESHNHDEGDLIAILQDLQAHYRYLPHDQLLEVAQLLEVPANRVYSVATFFRAFSLKPKGKHDLNVCTGTACHVRGAARLVDDLKRMLKTELRGTSPDKNFTLDTVNCVGSCALGPVIIVDSEVYGKVHLKDVKKILKTYQSKESKTDETPKSSGPGKKKSPGAKKKKS